MFALTVAVLGAAGVVSGLVWAALAPRVPFTMTQVGPLPSTEVAAGQLVSMDAWFAVLAGGGGLLLSTVLAVLFLRHGVSLVVALVVGGFLAAGLALVSGGLAGNGAVVLTWTPTVAVGTELTAPVMVHAYGVLLVWPIAVLAPIVPLAWLGWSDPVDRTPADHPDPGRPGPFIHSPGAPHRS